MDDEQVTDPKLYLTSGNVAGKDSILLRKGKKKYHRIIFT
jgi:hypothetical protein